MRGKKEKRKKGKEEKRKEGKEERREAGEEERRKGQKEIRTDHELFSSVAQLSPACLHNLIKHKTFILNFAE